MKLSEYIEKLEEEMRQFGDLEVVRPMDYGTFVRPLYAGSLKRVRYENGRYISAEKDHPEAFLVLVV